MGQKEASWSLRHIDVGCYKRRCKAIMLASQAHVVPMLPCCALNQFFVIDLIDHPV